MASLVPGFRRMAWQASSRLLASNQCLLRQVPRSSSSSSSSAPSHILNVVRSRAYATETTTQTTTTTTSPLGKLAKEMSTRPSYHAETEAIAAAKSRSFPETSSKGVAYWLLGSAVSVFGIVVFGGLTRMTESG